MSHAFKFGEAEIAVALSRASRGYRLHVGDEVLYFNLRHDCDGCVVLAAGTGEERAVVAVHGDEVFVHVAGMTYRLLYLHPLERLREGSAQSSELALFAPMPGAVVEVSVQAGQQVEPGDILMVIESMKMETALRAPRRCSIVAIHFEVGQSFERGATLVSLASAEVRA